MQLRGRHSRKSARFRDFDCLSFPHPPSGSSNVGVFGLAYGANALRSHRSAWPGRDDPVGSKIHLKLILVFFRNRLGLRQQPEPPARTSPTFVIMDTKTARIRALND